MPSNKILTDAESAMKKSVEFLQQELRGIRTGRASANLVDGVKVDVAAYGSTMGLKELANVAVAEGNIIVIKPFDPSTCKDIEKALEKSNLGINPQNDGKTVRLPVPPLSTERRNQLVQQIKQIGEAQKVAVRNVRRDANKALDAEVKAKTLTEDEGKSSQERVQKLTDQYVKQIDAMLDEKTKDVMEN